MHYWNMLASSLLQCKWRFILTSGIKSSWITAKLRCVQEHVKFFICLLCMLCVQAVCCLLSEKAAIKLSSMKGTSSCFKQWEGELFNVALV